MTQPSQDENRRANPDDEMAHASMPVSDRDLLRRYAEHGDQRAFTDLVQRHINLVYLAALRRVGRNAHTADDVTQKVFTRLAQKAGTLLDHTSLAGWLYTATRFIAADAVRSESRRHHYEQAAETMREINADRPISAEQLEPLLDEVMDLLSERDREAVLLHFFEDRTFQEIGAALAVSADAARMRVSRALERLRDALAHRGIASTATALAGALAVQSTLAAPPPLALTIANHALSQAGPLGAVPASARLLKLLRSPQFVWGTSAALVMATISAIAIVNHDTSTPLASTAAPESIAVAALPSAVDVPTQSPVVPRSEPATETRATPPSSRIPAAVFGDLSDAEQKLLVRLWFLHEMAVPPPGTKVNLKVGPQAPAAPGIEPLLERGLIEYGTQGGGIHLTKAGIAYCEKHRAEIEARAITMRDLGPRR